MPKHTQKIYCFADESGQDAGSNGFVVVVVVVWEDLQDLRQSLLGMEQRVGIGSKKWHKLRQKDRLEFIRDFLNKKYSNLRIYYGHFEKPTPYYFSTLEVVRKTSESFGHGLQAVISIDGLDYLSARKMTKALRGWHLRLKLIKGRRDESEVLIRLADRWAGCLRLALIDCNKECQGLVFMAEKAGMLKQI